MSIKTVYLPNEWGNNDTHLKYNTLRNNVQEDTSKGTLYFSDYSNFLCCYSAIIEHCNVSLSLPYHCKRNILELSCIVHHVAQTNVLCLLAFFTLVTLFAANHLDFVFQHISLIHNEYFNIFPNYWTIKHILGQLCRFTRASISCNNTNIILTVYKKILGFYIQTNKIQTRNASSLPICFL